MSLRVDLLEGARIALRSLGVNRLRTVLTLTAVGIGVATLLAILGIIQGLNGAFARQLASLGTATLNISQRPFVVHRRLVEVPEPQADSPWPRCRRCAQQSRLANAVVPEVNEDEQGAPRRRPERQRRGPGGHPGGLPEDLGATRSRSGRFLTDADSDAERQVVVIGVGRRRAGSSPDAAPWASRCGSTTGRTGWSACWRKKGKILDQSMDLVALIPFKTFLARLRQARLPDRRGGRTTPTSSTAREDEVTGIMRRVAERAARASRTTSASTAPSSSPTPTSSSPARSTAWRWASGSSPCWWAASAS